MNRISTRTRLFSLSTRRLKLIHFCLQRDGSHVCKLSECIYGVTFQTTNKEDYVPCRFGNRLHSNQCRWLDERQQFNLWAGTVAAYVCMGGLLHWRTSTAALCSRFGWFRCELKLPGSSRNVSLSRCLQPEKVTLCRNCPFLFRSVSSVRLFLNLRMR